MRVLLFNRSRDINIDQGVLSAASARIAPFVLEIEAALVLL